MCEAKFTKGDWKVHSVGSQFAVGPLSNSGDQSYGMMNVVAWIEKFDFYDEKQAELNAYLIAAAPKMHKKLDEICDFLLESGSVADKGKANEIKRLLKEVRGEHV